MSERDPEPEDGAPRLSEDGLPPLSRVIARLGLSASKALGQNFLLDLNLTRRIARAALAAPSGAPPEPTRAVLEIGPGPGGLTRALLMEGAGRVVVVERDRRCIPALEEIAERWPGRLTIVEGDALAIDPLTLLDGAQARIAANLPYNIGTELVVRWLRDRRAPDGAPLAPDALDQGWWASFTVMLQKEVAERITASPGSKAYGRLAALASWRARSRVLFDVSPKAFTPPPKVTSAILRADPLPRPGADCRLEDLEKITAAAFEQRRKMLRSSLKRLATARGIEVEAWTAAAGVRADLRADALGLAEFAALARALPPAG